MLERLEDLDIKNGIVLIEDVRRNLKEWIDRYSIDDGNEKYKCCRETVIVFLRDWGGL